MKPSSAANAALIEATRLSFRLFREADRAALTDVFGDKEVMQFAEAIRDEAWVKNWIAEQQKSQEVQGYSYWALVHKANSKVIGYCGLGYDANLDGRAEVALGYRLARAYWGRGYATEGVKATLDYALNKLGLSSVVATIDPSNQASIRVAEKAGMVFEKEIMRDWYTHPDYLYRLSQEALAAS